MTATQKLKPCPYKPAFNIGDRVSMAGKYAEDWRGVELIVGQVYWNRKRDRIEYGVYDCDKGALTDEIPEIDLEIAKAEGGAQ